jgi:YidC/Oxa1 family membrane protein insertase
MNDIRRTILWVIFAFSLVMLWDQWQVYNGRKATFFPSSSAPAAGRASAPASAVPPASASPGAAAVPPGGVAITPPTGGAAMAPAAASVARERIEVGTDVLKLVFDTEGGAIVKSEFLKFAAARPPRPALRAARHQRQPRLPGAVGPDRRAASPRTRRR